MNNEKINILIVDDEEQILKNFKAHFRTYYNVFTANNAEVAKKIIADNNIQVVLSDYNMPIKDGVLFFSELVLTNPDISRILITAHDSVTVAIESINVGNIYRFVQKPWNLDELKITIDQSYEFYRLKKENESLMERLLNNEKLIALLESKL